MTVTRTLGRDQGNLVSRAASGANLQEVTENSAVTVTGTVTLISTVQTDVLVCTAAQRLCEPLQVGCD